MIDEKKISVVKEILKSGYQNLDIISLELDISISELQEIQKQINMEKKPMSMPSTIKKTPNYTAAHIQRLRKLKKKIHRSF